LLATSRTRWQPGEPATPLERRLLEQIPLTGLLDLLGPRKPPSVAEMRKWGTSRTIRAAVLRHVLLAERGKPDAPTTVTIRGVRLRGLLDLANLTIPYALRIESCYLGSHGGATFDNTVITGLSITRCGFEAISAEGVVITKDLDLSGTQISAGTYLSGLKVAGSLICSGAILGAGAENNSLLGVGMQISGSAYLNRRFKASGGVRLTQSSITGSLYADTAEFGENREHNSLGARGLRLGGNLYLTRGFKSLGAIWLTNAEIAGEFKCSNALIGMNPAGDSLICDGMAVKRDLSLDVGLSSEGAVRLSGAEISGSVICDDAAFGANGDHRSIHGDRMRVRGNLSLKRTVTRGSIRLVQADVLGHVYCTAAKLNGCDDDGDTLNLTSAVVGSSLWLTGGLTTHGCVLLPQAQVTGRVRCADASLGKNNDGNSLLGVGMEVGRDLVFADGFSASGYISLRRARILGDLIWTPSVFPATGVNLEGAHAHRLCDSWENGPAQWPHRHTRLAGFSYDSFGSPKRAGAANAASLADRLAWIRDQYTPRRKRTAGDLEFATEPYRQLSKVYKDAGQNSEARSVEIAMRQDLREYGDLGWWNFVTNWLSDLYIGYGYKTWRAVIWLIGLYLAVLMLLLVAQHDPGRIVPTDTRAPVSAAVCPNGGRAYPCFYPAAEALVVVVPLINFEQTSYWRPSGPLMVAAVWTATGFGWALATLIVAGYSGLARRE
jgi:hypothetical protein